MVDVTTAFKNECEANVGTYKFGKVKVNLIDNNPASWEIGEYSSTNGTKIDTANMTRLSSLSKCEPNKQYTVSLNNSNFRLRLAYFNASQTYISSSAALTGGTITTPANTAYIGATLWNNANTYTGTNINLQNSTNDKLVSYNLEGSTIQDGTPAPTSPVDVQTIKGTQTINIWEHNFLSLDNTTWKTDSTLTTNIINNNSIQITFNGTSSSYKSLFQNNDLKLPDGRYDLSAIATATDDNTLVGIGLEAFPFGSTTRSHYYEFWFNATERANGTRKRTNNININNSKYYYRLRLFVSSSAITSNDVTFTNIMLKKYGDETEYEAYQGKTYKIDLGTNILNKTLPDRTSGDLSITSNGDGTYTLNGTTTSTTAYTFGSVVTSELIDILKVNKGKYITLSTGQSSNQGFYLQWNFGKTGGTNQIGYISGVSTYTSKLIDNTIDEYVWANLFVGIYGTNTPKTFNNVIIKPMLHISDSPINTVPEFVPYIEPIELNKIGDYKDAIRKGTGKNLFGNLENGYYDNNGTFQESNTRWCTPKIKKDNNTKIYFHTSNTTKNYGLCEFNSNGTLINREVGIATGNNRTFNANTESFAVFYYDDGNALTNGTQLEISFSPITYYEPYGFKDKWYIEKQTGKVVLNGSENWARTTTNTSSQFYFYVDNIMTNVLYNNSNVFSGISNIGVTTSAYQRVPGIDTIYYNNTSNRTRIYTEETKTMQTADFKTWLSTHNTIVYYILATPTTTEITDENLISQLETLNNTPLYIGTTNIGISGNLPAIMNIETDLSNNVRDTSAEPFMGFNITGDDDLISFKVTAKADSNGKPFGSVVKKQLDIEVFNENNKYDLENRQVKVSTGLAETTGNFCEWETFNITQTKDTQTKGHAQYTGYDNMVRATTPYIDNIDFGDSGITLYEFANEVVKQLGSTLGNEELPNGDFIITGNPFTNNETLEVVLRQLGELNGSFVEIGRDNKAWFRQIENTVSPMALSTNLYTEDFTKADKFGGVNKVVVGESNIETNAAIESDPTEIAKNGEQLIEVLDNYFMITMEQKEEICSSLWGMLEGFEYYPFKTKYNGFPYIDLGDNLEITDINSNNYLSVVLNYDFTYKGGYLGNVGASALSRTASKYKNNNTLGKQFRKVGIEVNRVDGKITAEVAAREEAIAETKDEVAGSYVATNVFDDYTSTINQTVGGIDTRVSATETTLYGANDDGLVKRVETNETNISQNATDISLTVGRVSSVESLAETTEANTKDIVNQFVFGEDGLTISNKGSTSDDMKLNLTNEQIAFLYRNNVVLKINGSAIEFSAASFQKLDLGNYVWQAEEDDSLSLIYEGGNT